MSLGEHLRELRNRVVKAAFSIVVGTIAGWFLYARVYHLLTAPIDAYKAANPDRAADIRLTYEGLTTAFSLQLSLSIFIGLIISSPIWLYQAWAFIVPGLTKHEKRVSYAFIGAAVPLFLLGIFLAHLSMPIVMGVLLDFAQQGTANFQQLSAYFNFVTRYMLGFGLAFLLPVFQIALNMVGILPAQRMMKAWRPAVFLIFVFSAIMMPTPDPYTMFLLAVPLIVLFFAAIGVARVLDRRKVAARPTWLDASDDEASEITETPVAAEPAAPVTEGESALPDTEVSAVDAAEPVPTPDVVTPSDSAEITGAALEAGHQVEPPARQ